MKVKVSEAEREVLDYMVAMAEGLGLGLTQEDRFIEIFLHQNRRGHGYCYSRDWAQGGPIIEREKIGVWWATHVVDDEGTEYGNHWYAEPGMTDENADKSYTCMTGPTPLVAAMRCFVASHLGNECDIPDELITGEFK